MPSVLNQGTASFHAVTPGFFDTVGVAITGGRDFTVDDRAGAPGVVIINTPIVAVTALAAADRPARRAANVEPWTAMRA